MPAAMVRGSAFADVDGQLEQLVGVGHALRGQHLAHPQRDAGKVVVVDLASRRPSPRVTRR